MKTLSKIAKTTLAMCAISLSTATYASVECQLGHTCSIPNTMDNVYYRFKPDQGNKFACELQATKGNELQVTISSGKDYKFPDQSVRAPKDGQVLTAVIPGTYSEGATIGEINVHQSLLTANSEGTVKCFATK